MSSERLPKRQGPAMTNAVASPWADLLTQAIDCVRRQLGPSLSAAQRIRLFWAGVIAARDLASSDVLEQEFLRLGRDCRFTANLGRHGDEDMAHVVRWALLGRNPFGAGGIPKHRRHQQALSSKEPDLKTRVRENPIRGGRQ
jgi:hypothetical protein